MPDKKKPIPKTQAQLFKEQADAVATGAKPILPDFKKREVQRSVKDDDVKRLHIGLRDIYVHVAEDNDSALNLYKKNSFFEHGECSDEWHDREAKMIRLHWKAQ